MKREEKEKLRQTSLAELHRLLAEKRKALVETRLKLRLGKLKDVHLPGKIRHEIAYLLMLIKQKQKDKKNA